MHSYPKIYNLGHRAIADLLKDAVVVQEKVDGSQFSFGLYKEGKHIACDQGHYGFSREERVLKCRSKGAMLNLDAPEKMFHKAVEVVRSIEHTLVPGWTYRCEYLQSPKHNTLAYNRVPQNHLMLFDVDMAEEDYLQSFGGLVGIAEALGIEAVPELFRGRLTEMAELAAMLKIESALGGQKIEGVVVKNYNRFGIDKKVLMGKHVSEAFKEIHSGEWRKANPTHGDILDSIVARLRTPARWEKAIQHLRDAGLLEDSPRDIGLLLREIQEDTLTEAQEEVVEDLLKWALPHIRRGIVKGVPEWYKERLMQQQFVSGGGDANAHAVS